MTTPQNTGASAAGERKPDCAVCGKPYWSHNVGAITTCPIIATYRPLSTPATDAGEVERLMHVIDRDRYVVAYCIGRVTDAIRGRAWLLEGGRGPYEWDDNRFREEFADAVKAIEEAVQPLRIVAWDKSDCTRIDERVNAAKLEARELLAKPLGPRGMIEADIFGDPRDAEIDRLRAQIASLSSASHSAVGEMRSWHGGSEAPADWDGGKVKMTGGWWATPDRDGSWHDVACYTPKAGFIAEPARRLLERIADNVMTGRREGAAQFHAGCEAIQHECEPLFVQLGMTDEGDGWGFNEDFRHAG